MSIDWKQLGYAKAVADLTGAANSDKMLYPTQDKYTAKDEAEYCAGYKLAQCDYKTSGFNLDGYLQEKS